MPWRSVSASSEQRPISAADLVVSLGGDGTMLRTIQLLDGAAVPVLGVNIGVLGYLTEVEPSDLNDSLEMFGMGPERGGWHIDERLMLDVGLTGAVDGYWRTLNEAVVEKLHAGHTVRLLARIDGAPFTSYAADGLIVATPTGSTAYSLSARGPIVSPRHRALLLTPVAPHMLFDRTLVLDPSETVEIEVVGHRPAELAVDGRQVAHARRGRRRPVHSVGSVGEVRPVRRTALPPDPQGQVRAHRSLSCGDDADEHDVEGDLDGPPTVLTELHIENLGVIERVTLVIGPGLTAVTGETGAGKTMLVEALELLVGGRADVSIVRVGATEARVDGRFDRDGDELVLSRVIPVDGRSPGVCQRPVGDGCLAGRAHR